MAMHLHMQELKWGHVHRAFAKKSRQGSAQTSWRRGIAELNLKKMSRRQATACWEGKKNTQIFHRGKEWQELKEISLEKRTQLYKASVWGGPLSSLEFEEEKFEIIPTASSSPQLYCPPNSITHVHITNFDLASNGTVSYSSSELKRDKKLNG